MSAYAIWAARCARASRIGGISESIFWNLTPAETEGILKEASDEFRDRETLTDRRFALVCSTMCNLQGADCTLEDFLPKQETEVSQEEIEMKCALIFGTNS